ncbi:MAG: SGNH/GDSL hydrolase family protein [Candidatus Hydrogenedentes bacterium]|nr:SGNH/GDSL hydrolase family protein [Candidatus Hydrogenedentota bacterium]
MRKIIKLFYGLFVAVMWILVLCLSLELFTRVVLKTANYLYRPLFEMQNAKAYKMVKLSEELEEKYLVEKDYKPKDQIVFSSPKSSDLTSINGDYLCKKNYELTLKGVAEIYFDIDGNIIESYGDPLIERYIYNIVNDLPVSYNDSSWDTVLEVIRNPSLAPYSAQLRYIGTYNHYYQVEITQQSDGLVLIARELRDSYPLSLIATYTSKSEDSAWLVPFFAYKPNVDRYNNLGFRDEDIILPKPEGVLRILCVGGSTTEEGPSNDVTYPNIMERKLRKYFNTDKIEVINAGVIGQRSFGEVRRVNDFISLQPDLVVYYNAINDICLVDMPQWLKLPNSYRDTILYSDLLTRIFNRKLLPSDDYIADYFHRTIFRNLGAMNCGFSKQNIRMAICSFAYPKIEWYEFVARLYFDFNMRNAWLSLEDVMITFDTYIKVIQIYNRELKKFCERENILYIPVAEELNGGTDYFTDVCHMTQLGLYVKADIISSYVAKWIEESYR